MPVKRQQKLRGSVSHATLANCPTERTLQKREVISYTNKSDYISYGISRRLRSNLTVKTIKALHSIM